MSRIAVAILIAGIGALYLAHRYVGRTCRTPLRAASAPPVTLIVEPGMTPRRIFTMLAAASVGPDTRVAELYYRLYGTDTLKAGEYEIKGGLSFDDILRMMEAGEVVLHLCTIPEGLTAAEIAFRLEQEGLFPAAQYLGAARKVDLVAAYDPEAESLEGYLFPNTYSFPRGVTARQVVATQVSTFLDRYLALRQKDAPALGFRDAVVLASLVEKETGQELERPLVASVFMNRLRRHMLLQCDPTVIYAMMIDGTYSGNIRRSDLSMDSPYNTYRYPGLPPGPICNPGMSAIEASIYPPETKYLYFVSRNDRTHIFSESLEAHNRAVNRFQRGR